MPNAKDAADISYQKILVLGEPGAGKSTQLWSLPGKKFAYFFDPNAVRAVRGLDIDYEEFLPDATDMDATMKAFNKDARPSDRPKNPAEPKAYNLWQEDFNKRVSSNFFASYDWIILDSLSSLVNIMFDRLLWVNKRFGEVEEQSDLKLVGAKLSDVFRSILTEDVNFYCTGHINSFTDDKTKRTTVQLNLPGRARRQLPLLFTDILELRSSYEGRPNSYVVLTKSEDRGFQGVRTSIQGLEPVIDVTIQSPDKKRVPLREIKEPWKQGLGAIISKHMPPLRGSVSAPTPAPAPAPAPTPNLQTPAIKPPDKQTAALSGAAAPPVPAQTGT